MWKSRELVVPRKVKEEQHGMVLITLAKIISQKDLLTIPGTK
jgi:hypothetical protein